ncbi:hypothetical protein [Leifsonia aquatica]|uniref:hypothetical protein n=1 Tax=Leifsonia aquatica TaxID=144185 RepID=UPI0004693716|nr:hypothetical protein [Leifsonia aquatica]
MSITVKPGDIIRATNGDTSIEGRLDSTTDNPAHIAFAGTSILVSVLLRDGFVIERVEAALPTTPGIYVTATDDPDGYVYRLTSDGRWLAYYETDVEQRTEADMRASMAPVNLVPLVSAPANGTLVRAFAPRPVDPLPSIRSTFAAATAAVVATPAHPAHDDDIAAAGDDVRDIRQ